MSTVVECTLCPRRCKLIDGQRGDCRVRINLEGKLQTLVFGNPCSVHIDPIEKKPFYHVLPGTRSFSIATAGCNLHCKYCQNWQISQMPPEELENYDLVPASVVEKALATNCRTIAYTYSDPVVFFEYTLETSKIARPRGILNILRTGAYIEEEPLRELLEHVDAINVDFKGITEEFYQGMSGGHLEPVLKAMKLIQKQGVWLELTNLIIPTWNDKDGDIKLLCRWIMDHLGPNVPLHFSRFWPQHQLKNLPPTPEETIIRARQIALQTGIRHTYVGNLPEDDGNHTYCPEDGTLLIRRVGYDVLENNLSDGRCPKCNAKIPGLWI